MAEERHRHVVLGCGALGAAATFWLARETGGDVVALEQFELGHERGASEDHSRIIRHAYHSSVYTRLTPHAYAAWEEVEAESGLELVVRCGGLHLVEPGGAGGEVLDDYAVALREVGIPFELLDAEEIRRRHPQWRVDEGTVGLYQRDGGILDIGRATAAHLALARARGATVLPHTEVLGIADGADGVEVRTSRGTLLAEHLVVCAGAWTPRLLADALGVHLPIALTREQVTYFATPHVRDFLPDRFGVWSWHGTDVLYGFPIHGLVAAKAAIDMGGPFVDGPQDDVKPDPDRVARVLVFLERHLPGAAGPPVRSRQCLYDMPPDRDFVLDALPGHPRVHVAIGAGHAAKFAGLLGRLLAERVLTGSTSLPTDAFRLDRPALVDAAHATNYRLRRPRAPTA